MILKGDDNGVVGMGNVLIADAKERIAARLAQQRPCFVLFVVGETGRLSRRSDSAVERKGVQSSIAHCGIHL